MSAWRRKPPVLEWLGAGNSAGGQLVTQPKEKPTVGLQMVKISVLLAEEVPVIMNPSHRLEKRIEMLGVGEGFWRAVS